LTGAARGSFAELGSNWFTRPQQATLKAWQADIALLGETHRTLRGAIAALDPSALNRPLTKASRTTRRALVSGIAAHDIYHAGQIQLVKALGRRRA
jgi:hypothetical protein